MRLLWKLSDLFKLIYGNYPPPNVPHTPMNRAQPAGTIKKTAVENHSDRPEKTKGGQGTPVLP